MKRTNTTVVEFWLTSRACRVSTFNGCVNKFICFHFRFMALLSCRWWCDCSMNVFCWFRLVMKTVSRDILFQGLILSLTTQLALSLVADKASPRSAAAPSSHGIVGTLYRSAELNSATPEKDTSLTQTARGQRCVRCGQSGYYGGNGGYTDRWAKHSSEIPFKSICKRIFIVCGLKFISISIQFTINVDETNDGFFLAFRWTFFFVLRMF